MLTTISRLGEVGGKDCEGNKNVCEMKHNNQEGIIMLPLKKLHWLAYYYTMMRKKSRVTFSVQKETYNGRAKIIQNFKRLVLGFTQKTILIKISGK